MRSYRLRDFRWQGMLSIWGQDGAWYQGVCYSNLCHSPKMSIRKIGKDEAPVTVFLIRYLDMKSSMDYFDHCINHLIPEEILKHCTFTRIHEKTMNLWPQRYMCKLDRNDVLNPENFEYDDAVDEEEMDKIHANANKGPLMGCYPWMRVDFSQELSPMSIFAVSVMLRYVSEHGMAVKALEALKQMDFNLNGEELFSIASLLGQARGHAIGNYGYTNVEALPAFLKQSTWKKNFLKMEAKYEPFWKNPQKLDDIDNFFKWVQPPRIKATTELYAYPGNPEVEYTRNDVTIKQYLPNMNLLFKHLESV